MTAVTRTILILTLLTAMAGELFAQEEATTTAETTATTTTTTEGTTTAAAEKTATTEAPGSYELRTQLTNVIRRYPPELGSILALDPTLLSNDAFLAGYPQLAAFVASHPQVRQHSRYYLGEFFYIERDSDFDRILEPLMVLFSVVFTALAFSWLVRTVIEQRRWTKLSRTQSEVHNKILDRFGTTSELLEYVKTPAGTKFLESAPIPLHSESGRSSNPPLTRVLLSIQAGVVIAITSLGMVLVSLRYEKDTEEGLFGLGMIGFCIGAGFIVSAVVSMYLSRRLGLWQSSQGSELSPDA